MSAALALAAASHHAFKASPGTVGVIAVILIAAWLLLTLRRGS